MIYLAAPVTQFIDGEKNFTDQEFMNFIESALRHMMNRRIQYFSAHEREDFGRNLYSPHEALVDDVLNLQRCSHLVAVLGNPASPGVQLEIGYSIARKIPMFIFAEQYQNLPYLMRGVDGVASSFQYYSSYEDLSRKVFRTIDHIAFDH